MHEAPPDVADGTQHPWASSNTEYGQGTHCRVRREQKCGIERGKQTVRKEE